MAAFDPDEVVRKLTQRLKMRHCVLLLRIEQHGSLTRVAEDMATSQPAITKALAELETMFGAELFDRSVRGMAPTPLGRIALARARAMVHDLNHLARDMEAVAAGHAAHLHAGVIPFISGQILSSAIQHATSSGERRLVMTLREGDSHQLLAQLRDHTLDLVVGRASAAVDLQGLDFDVLYSQQPRLISSRRLAAQLARRPPDWHRLVELDWILGAVHTPEREQVSNVFLEAGITPPTPIVESYSTKLIGELIAANDQAISIVPADVAEELVRIAGVAIVPYSFNWTLPPIALFTRKRDQRRQAYALLADALRDVGRKHAGRSV
ncbi:MAG: LysR substrate-binding domain-containing protein [Pusillimonas sp.]